jgi:hypothetical protein
MLIKGAGVGLIRGKTQIHRSRCLRWSTTILVDQGGTGGRPETSSRDARADVYTYRVDADVPAPSAPLIINTFLTCENSYHPGAPPAPTPAPYWLVTIVTALG